jgi:hypothetical protein
MKAKDSIKDHRRCPDDSLFEWKGVSSNRSRMPPGRHGLLEQPVLDDDRCEAEQLEEGLVSHLSGFLPRTRDIQSSLENIDLQYRDAKLVIDDTLENELKLVIPKLKSLYENKEDDVSYIRVLKNKEAELEIFQRDLEEKFLLYCNDEDKLAAVLEKVDIGNQKAMERAKLDGLNSDHIDRISMRIELWLVKLRRKGNGTSVKSKISKPNFDHLPEKERRDTQPGLPIETPFYKTNKNESLLNVVSSKDCQVPSTDPALTCLLEKIDYYSQFSNYLQNNLKVERSHDLKYIINSLAKMNIALDEINARPLSKTVSRIKIDFPDFDSKFIIGMERDNRDKKIDDILGCIRQDMAQVKTASAIEIYKKHYTPIIGRLLQVKDSEHCPMPVITKNAFSFATQEINKSISNGDLVLRIDGLKNAPFKRCFFLSYEFKYEAKLITDSTKYCDDNGLFNFEKTYRLDTHRLSRHLSKEKITFSLYKKKYVFGSRLVSSATINLEKLNNFMDFKAILEFEYKSCTRLLLEIEINIHKALENPLKEIELYEIERQIPEFVYRPSTRSLQASLAKHSSKLTADSDGGCLENRLTVNNRTFLKDGSRIFKDSVNPLKRMSKFPILSSNEKRRLCEMTKIKDVPKSIAEYQLELFGIRFLEELIAELEIQMGQMDLGKYFTVFAEADEMLGQARKALDGINQGLKSGELSYKEYKTKLKKIVKKDETNIVFYEQCELRDSATFVKNRVILMKAELRSLKE